MKTPFGQECRFFYGDYYRGRNFEECRGLINPNDKAEWTSLLCETCPPVPNIQRNNNCPNLVLTTFISKSWFKKTYQDQSKLQQNFRIGKGPPQRWLRFMPHTVRKP